jgi:hypothetical protein
MSITQQSAGIATAVVLAPLRTLYYAWGMHTVWSLLVAGPTPSYGVFAAVSLVASLVLPAQWASNTEDDDISKRVMVALLLPPYCVVVAWLVGGLI